MIRFFDKKDTKSIVAIWKEAFHDRESNIIRFLERFGSYMLVFEEDKIPVSMLALFPVTLKGEKGRYVYAVATDKRYRMRGFAGALIGYAKDCLKANNERFLVILPQNDGLYGFYGKFGFSELNCAERFDKAVSLSEKSALNAEKITAEEYFQFRKKYFSDRGYVEWSPEMLHFFEEMYSGCYLKISNSENVVAVSFCHADSNKAVVSELLSKEKNDEIFSAVARFFGKERAIGVSAKENGGKFGMIYPKKYSDSYFGIGMN